MVIVFLLVFAVALFGLAIGGAKLSKAARKSKMKQDLALLKELQAEQEQTK